MATEPVQDPLVHCIYTSAETVPFSPADILLLLDKARKTNLALGISGMLLYDHGTFFQILEGHPNAIKFIFRKIEADKRHARITKIILEPIGARDFSEWTMGYAGVSRETLGKIPGLNDFFHSGKCYTDLDDGRARKLLDGFKDGKWRTSIR
jgi:hypothetical protein